MGFFSNPEFNLFEKYNRLVEYWVAYLHQISIASDGQVYCYFGCFCDLLIGLIDLSRGPKGPYIYNLSYTYAYASS